jgi:hypothetical protein
MIVEDLAERLDRIESSLAIQQLPIRYALAVDSRDIDGWVALFAADVDCGRFGIGREALRQTIAPPLATCYRTVHQICGHEYHFLGPDQASGHVYCRAEHEIGEAWMVMAICYFDDYVRQDGRWYFARRRERHWYAVDQREGPRAPFVAWPSHGKPPTLPAEWPTWAKFWSQVPQSQVAGITTEPVPPR